MNQRRLSQTRIGISGWTYGPWRGAFYPARLAHKRELEYASRQLNSIEINGSFYSLQRPSSYETWYRQTPDNFVFSVKGGRFITHMKKLKDVDMALANFFASGVLLLREKLGPILWQFPPGFALNLERFRDFFRLLPKDTPSAVELARGHNEKLSHGASTTTDATRRLRYAVEIRHESFKTKAFVELLREFNIALVFADTAKRFPYTEDLTADFIYCRLHGDEELYVSGYTDSALQWWAKRIRAWQRGEAPGDTVCRAPPAKTRKKIARDVFVYFDNDAKVRAPFDAMSLSARLDLPQPRRLSDMPDLTGAGEAARQHWPSIGSGRKRAGRPRRKAKRST